MRTSLLLVGLALVSAAARAQNSPAPAHPETPAGAQAQPGSAPAQAAPGSPQAPSPTVEPKKPAAGPAAQNMAVLNARAPERPSGLTPEQASAEVPQSGTVARIDVQGNRRVEADAIRNVLSLKAGDTYDKDKLKTSLLSVWKMGYFADVRLDVSPALPPLQGYILTVLVAEKPADLKPFGLDRPQARWRFAAGGKEKVTFTVGAF